MAATDLDNGTRASVYREAARNILARSTPSSLDCANVFRLGRNLSVREGERVTQQGVCERAGHLTRRVDSKR